MVNILDFGTSKSALLSAIASGAKSIYFPAGEYNYIGNPINLDRAITLYGDGPEASIIKLTTGFRTNTGGLEVRDLAFKASTIEPANVAFKTSFPDTGITANISGFHFENCHFHDFFYATYLAGANPTNASDPSFVPRGYVTRVKIINCESFAPPVETMNSGHFQHVLTRDVLVTGCSTYGGGSAVSDEGAASYNFIGNNGYLRVSNNYDAFNTYASIEIENNSGQATVTGNIVGSDIWIDDSVNVQVHANYVERDIRVSVAKFNVQNVSVIGNHAARIRVERYIGTQINPLTVDAILISKNTLNGIGDYGVFIGDPDNRIKRVDVEGNFITGDYSAGCIGIGRRSNLYAKVRDNWFLQTITARNIVVVTGTAGYVGQSGNVAA